MTEDDAKIETLRLFHAGVTSGSRWRWRGKLALDEEERLARVSRVQGSDVHYIGEIDDWFYRLNIIDFRAQFEPV